MQVVHICQRDDPATGGAVRVATELTKNLIATGIGSKLLFVYGPKGHFATELPSQCAYLSQEKTGGNLGNIVALFRWLQQESPDIIHHHDGLAWTHVASRCTGIPVVGHGHLFATARNPTPKTRLTNWIHRKVYRRLFAVAQSVAESWNRAGFPPSKTSVIPNGIDSRRFHLPSKSARSAARDALGLQPADAVLLFVGRLDIPMKGCDDFLKVIASLPKHYRGIVAGSGPDAQALKDMAHKLGITKRVTFVGNQTDTRPLYWAADIFLLTSRYEPFGLVLLEAAACGLPTVVFPGEGEAPRLSMKIAGHLLRDRDISGAAACIQRVFNTDSAPCRSQRHELCADLFSWRQSAQELKREYDLLLATC